jgi:hypothetical protein
MHHNPAQQHGQGLLHLSAIKIAPSLRQLLGLQQQVSTAATNCAR